MLCKDCDQICVRERGNTWLQREIGKPLFKPSLHHLQSSAKSGCQCCTFLLHCIESAPRFQQRISSGTEAVTLSWWRNDMYKDGGAQVSLVPSTEDRYRDEMPGTMVPSTSEDLEVELDICTIRGTCVTIVAYVVYKLTLARRRLGMVEDISRTRRSPV
jgi:hypothetical protein